MKILQLTLHTSLSSWVSSCPNWSEGLRTKKKCPINVLSMCSHRSPHVHHYGSASGGFSLGCWAMCDPVRLLCWLVPSFSNSRIKVKVWGSNDSSCSLTFGTLDHIKQLWLQQSSDIPSLENVEIRALPCSCHFPRSWHGRARPRSKQQRSH